MDPYDSLDTQMPLDGSGLLDLGVYSATCPQTFPQQPAAPHGALSGFHAPGFPPQTRGYPPRQYQGFPRSFAPQAPDAERPVNIVLPNGGTDAQSLLTLSSKVERLAHKMQELTSAVARSQEETKASLDSLKTGLDRFMSSITVTGSGGATGEGWMDGWNLLRLEALGLKGLGTITTSGSRQFRHQLA